MLNGVWNKHPQKHKRAKIARSEERRVGKSVDLGGRRIIKKKKNKETNKKKKKTKAKLQKKN